MEIAGTLVASNGEDKAGASAGELIAAALLVGRPEWTGYGHILDSIHRLGPQWLLKAHPTKQYGNSVLLSGNPVCRS